ncbi:hypothetical protein A2U01_0087979, partial [Trifolium medium]|nr:hypothetical protein [Trifolium medium]
EVIPLQVVAAQKLMLIEEEVGLNFHGKMEDNLARTVAIEERDRGEKAEWEVNRGPFGFQ